MDWVQIYLIILTLIGISLQGFATYKANEGRITKWIVIGWFIGTIIGLGIAAPLWLRIFLII